MGVASKRLKRARKIRHYQAELLEGLRDGNVSIKSVCEAPGDAAKRISVHTLLTNTKHIGEKGAEHIEKRAKVWPTHRLGNLTKKERDALVAALPPRVL